MAGSAEMSAKLEVSVLSDKARAELRALSQEVDATSKHIKGGMQEASIATDLAGAAMGAGLIVIAKKAIETSSAVEEMKNRFAVAFGDATSSMKQWAEETAKDMGRSKYDMMDYAASFQTLFKAMNFGTSTAANMSKQLAKLSVDLSSFRDVSAEEIMVNLKSGLVGETEAVRKFGIDLSEGALKAELYAMGLRKNAEEATMAEKMQARLNLIMRQTTMAQGDAARTIDSWSNMMRVAAAAVKDISIAVGDNLIPSLKGMVSTGIDVARWMAEFATTPVGSSIVQVTAAVAAGSVALQGMALGMKTLAGQAANIPGMFTAIGTSAKAMWGMVITPAGQAVIAIAAISVAVSALVKWQERRKQAAREAAAEEAAASIDSSELKTEGRIAQAEAESLRKELEDLKKTHGGLLKEMVAPLTSGGLSGSMAEKAAIKEKEEELKRLEATIEAVKKRLVELGDTAGAADLALPSAQQAAKQLEEYNKAADKATAATKAQQDAAKAVDDAWENLDETITNAADKLQAAKDAEKEAADAISKAWTDAGEKVADAYDNWQKAIDAQQKASDHVREVEEDNAKAIADAQDKANDATQKLSDLRIKQADDQIRALEKLREAEDDIADARLSAKERADKQVKDARDKITKAQERFDELSQPELTKEQKQWRKKDEAYRAIGKARDDLKRIENDANRDLDKALDKEDRRLRDVRRSYNDSVRDRKTALDSAVKSEDDAWGKIDDVRTKADKNLKAALDSEQAAIQATGKVQTAYYNAIQAGEDAINDAYKKHEKAMQAVTKAEVDGRKAIEKAMDKVTEANQRYEESTKKATEATEKLLAAMIGNARAAEIAANMQRLREQEDAAKKFYVEGQVAAGKDPGRALMEWNQQRSRAQAAMRERIGMEPRDLLALPFNEQKEWLASRRQGRAYSPPPSIMQPGTLDALSAAQASITTTTAGVTSSAGGAPWSGGQQAPVFVFNVGGNISGDAEIERKILGVLDDAIRGAGRAGVPGR